MEVRYTMSRINKDDQLYGPSHGSDDSNVTLCGQETDANWYVTHNNSDGEVTCKKCLEAYLRKALDTPEGKQKLSMAVCKGIKL